MVANPVSHARGALAVAAIAFTALPIQAAPVPGEVISRPGTDRLMPSSPWNLDQGETQCRLQRLFEKDGKPHLLAIEQNAPNRSFTLIVAGPSLTRLKGVRQVAFGLRADQPISASERIMPGTMPDYGAAFIITSVSLDAAAPEDGLRSAAIDMEGAAKVSRVVLGNSSGKEAVSFETGPMRAVFEALNACTGDLLAGWGLDPEQHRAYRPPQLTNVPQLMRHFMNTFPDLALANDENGTFNFRLIVEADGTVSGCHIDADSRAVALDPRCDELIKLARMAPARDAEGRPMRSFYTSRLTFRTS